MLPHIIRVRLGPGYCGLNTRNDHMRLLWWRCGLWTLPTILVCYQDTAQKSFLLHRR